MGFQQVEGKVINSRKLDFFFIFKAQSY